MFKINNKETISAVFIINFEHISHLVLVFLLLTLSRQMPARLHITAYFVFHTFIICDVVSVNVISYVIPLEKTPIYQPECKA